ncbi:MAG: sulfatase [Candidatus Omnitrophica bacterium]|nr:sulfatase [Candidatus Omnitrophota bacterium]
MTNRTLFAIASLTLFTSIAMASNAQSPQKPNIIFILVDDMRWDQLGITGHPFVQTPNIDRIGKEGVIFDNAFVCTPLCSPSRASFLTGQYPHTHRVINNDRNGLGFISHKLVTFPMMLRKAGYETAFIGKWHMGHDDTRRPGFDHWISFVGQGLFLDPVVNIDGERKQCDGYMTDLLNQWTLDFLKKDHEKPFLLYLSHKAVHLPFIPAERHSDLYSDQHYTPPPTTDDDLSGKPALQREVPPVDKLTLLGATPEPAEPRYGRPDTKDAIFLDHLRCLASVDDGVGQIFDVLEEKGELDNTLIIFTSDNGFLFGEHGEFRNKRVAYEESLRIPLLMRYPKVIEPGGHRGQMALNIDIAPTLYDLTGVESPIPIHGKSLLPALQDAEADIRDSFLGEYYLEKISPKHAEWKAVRTRNSKYIHYPNLEGMDELYDLKNDPLEMTNLIYSPDHQEELKNLQKELVHLLDETGGSQP